MKNNKLIYVLILAAIVCVTSCRKEEEIVPPTSLQVVYPDPNPGEIKGFFLLNEGNMGNNKPRSIISIMKPEYIPKIFMQNAIRE